MDSVVFFSVLAAALMHASWNALVRGQRPFAFMIVLTLAECVLGVALYFFFPGPIPPACRGCSPRPCCMSATCNFLTEAYARRSRAGHLLSRSSAPMIVTSSAPCFSARYRPTKVVAAVCIRAWRDGDVAARRDFGRIPPRALAFALGTACSRRATRSSMRSGRRASHSASACHRARCSPAVGRGARRSRLRARRRLALSTDARTLAHRVAGPASRPFSPGWVAIWAFTQAPVALAALRETNVLMAMLIGVVFMGERGGRAGAGAQPA